MLKLYAVSDEFIRYLRVENNIIHVFDNKEGHRTHDRKYVGVVISIGDIKCGRRVQSPGLAPVSRPQKEEILKKVFLTSKNPTYL